MRYVTEQILTRSFSASRDMLMTFTKQVLKMTAYHVDFSNEELCMCYSDISEDNFLITNAGQIYVIDFQDAAFLPTSFMTFVLKAGIKPLAQTISDKVSLPKSINLDAMFRATHLFHMISNRALRKSVTAEVNRQDDDRRVFRRDFCLPTK